MGFRLTLRFPTLVIKGLLKKKRLFVDHHHHHVVTIRRSKKALWCGSCASWWFFRNILVKQINFKVGVEILVVREKKTCYSKDQTRDAQRFGRTLSSLVDQVPFVDNKIDY